MLIAPSNVSDNSHSNNAYKGKALHYDMTCISDIHIYIYIYIYVPRHAGQGVV